MKLAYIAIVTLFTVGLFSCHKNPDCTNSPANAPSPVVQTTFRLVDTAGNDLYSSQTAGHFSFDSLVARQPCNANNVLGKQLDQIGAGSLESYKFSFVGDRQPITGENKECFMMYLDLNSADTDTLEFITTSVHDDCGISYSLDNVFFNGDKVWANADGVYVLIKR